MPSFVLDSWALLAFLKAEAPAFSRVEELLYEAQAQQIECFISLINLGEVYYISGRTSGKSQADHIMDKIHELPLTILLVDETTVIQAARYKMSYPISYADAFAVVAALQQNAILVTGDPEFDKLQGLIKIEKLQCNA